MRALAFCILGITLTSTGCEIRTCGSHSTSESKPSVKQSCDDCDCCSDVSRASVLQAKKDDAPAIELKTVKFDAFIKDVKAQSGKVVCAYQWASTHPASKKNLPILLELQRKLGKDRVVLMTASSDFAKDRSAVLKHLESLPS